MPDIKVMTNFHWPGTQFLHAAAAAPTINRIHAEMPRSCLMNFPFDCLQFCATKISYTRTEFGIEIPSNSSNHFTFASHLDPHIHLLILCTDTEFDFGRQKPMNGIGESNANKIIIAISPCIPYSERCYFNAGFP